MSAWRMLVSRIHSQGPEIGSSAEGKAIQQAKNLGLIESGGLREPWELTRLGLDWCEGRVEQVESKPGGRRFVATWLMALPRS